MPRKLTDEELAEAFALYCHTMWSELAREGWIDKGQAEEAKAMREIFYEFTVMDCRKESRYGITITHDQQMAMFVAYQYECGACGLDRLLRPEDKGTRCSKCPCKWELPDDYDASSDINIGDARCEYHGTQYRLWVIAAPQQKKVRAKHVLRAWKKRTVERWLKEFVERKIELEAYIKEREIELEAYIKERKTIRYYMSIIDSEYGVLAKLTEPQVIKWLIEGYGATEAEAKEAVKNLGFSKN